MGTLGNFTLPKRSEILEKSSVNESLKDSLLSSPLSDTIFGLSVQEVQEEMKKLPQPVQINVQVTNGKRSVSYWRQLNGCFTVFSIAKTNNNNKTRTV